MNLNLVGGAGTGVGLGARTPGFLSHLHRGRLCAWPRAPWAERGGSCWLPWELERALSPKPARASVSLPVAEGDGWDM